MEPPAVVAFSSGAVSPAIKAPLKRLVRLAPAWALRAGLRALPGDSRRWGPPRRFKTMRELAAAGAGEWLEAYSAMHSGYPLPVATIEDGKHLRRFQSVSWAPTGMIVLPRARLLTEHALPITAADEFVVDAAWNDGRPVYEALVMRGTARIDRRAGTALNLGSAWAGTNYGHFLLDTLPRLHLLERTGGRLDQFDWIVLPRFASAGADRIVAALGLPPAKLLRPERGTQLAFDAVWQPSYPCANQARHYPPWVPEFYRERFLFDPAPCPRRLYLTRRRGRRSLANEAELEPWLRRQGFEIVDPGRVANGPELFASAEVVIAPHGAAMADLAFCPPGTAVVEILPPNWLWPYFYSLSCAAGLRYHAVIGERAGRDEHGETRFRVDPAKFTVIAESALSRVGERGS